MASNDLRGVRPLLPAPLTNPAAGAAERLLALPPRKRGKQVDLACDACKKRKSKCDGRRPECLACERKGTECFYDEQGREANKVAGLKRQNNALEEELSGTQHILSFLRQCSEAEALVVLTSLRDGTDIMDIITDPALSSTSEVKLAPPFFGVRGRHYSFDTTESGEMEQSTISYTLNRLELFSLARRSGLVDEATLRQDEDVDRLVFAVSIPKVPHTPRQYHDLARVRSPRFSPEPVFGAQLSSSPPVARHHPFLRLNAQPWTTVTTDDFLFSRLICLWLSFHAPCLPYVYPTSFIAALETGTVNEHCAPVLVNAVLALASHYSTESMKLQSQCEQPYPRGLAFYDEAHRLWRAEEGRPSLVQLQASIAMYEFNRLRGKDRVGWIFLQVAVQMAIDMGLCNPEEGRNRMSAESEFAHSFVGWAIYNYQAVESLAYGRTPRIRRCRARRITGPLKAAQVTERWRPFDISVGVLRDSYFWQHWSSFCSLADILVDAACLLSADETDGLRTPQGLLLQQIEDITAEASVWHSRLPSVLSLEANEMPHNLWLHMNYYMLIVSLDGAKPGFRVPVTPSQASPSDVRSIGHHFTATEIPESNCLSASRNIVNLAGIGLEHFGHEHYSAYDGPICATAAYNLIQYLDMSEIRDDFRQCVSLLHTQADRFLFAGALARSILLIANDFIRGQSERGSEAERSVSKALEQNMAFDYLSMSRTGSSCEIMTKASGNMTRHSATPKLAGFVSSMFPTTTESMSGDHSVLVGDRERVARTGGLELDEILDRFENLQLHSGGRL